MCSWPRPSSSRGSTSRRRTRSSSTGRTGSASRSSTSSAAGWAATGSRRTPTSSSPPTGASTRRRPSGSACSRSSPRSARGSRSRSATWRSAGRGTCSGAQQHGQIEMVGFDLYLKLLEEAVRELRGEPVEDEVDPVVTVDAAAYLPEDYVAEPAQRLALYKRLAGIGTAAEIEDVRRELRDRFGPLPEAAARLLDVVALRLDAKALRLERLEVRAGHALLTFAPSTPVPAQRIVDLLRTPRAPAPHGAGVRARGHGRPRAVAGDLPDPHPAPRRVPRTDGGTPMKRARLALAGLVVAGALGACKAPAGPLPPVPAGSGGVLVRVGEAPPIRDNQVVIDRVVAVVNGDVVMMSDLQEAIVLSRRDGRERARRRRARADDAEPAGRPPAPGPGSQARQGRGDRRRRCAPPSTTS